MRVLCRGRAVDDQGQPEGPECGRQFRAPWPPERWSRAELGDAARAAGWSVLPWDAAAHGPHLLVGMCPRCRRPPAEVLQLVREVDRRG